MKRPASTPKPPVRHPSGGIVRGLLVVLLVLFCFGGSAALIYHKSVHSPSYESRAKLLVRYVIDRSAVDPYESKVDAIGNRGREMMDAELEIIKSADLALQVAEKIGPDKILPGLKEPPTKTDAAKQIVKNLKVKSAERSNVIHLRYRHPKPEIAVSVLKQLIETYFERHLEIHRSTGSFGEIQRAAEIARSRLSQTEQELAKLSLESGFLSPADGKAALESRRSAIRQNLMDRQVQLAEQQAKVAAVESPQTQGTDLNVERARLASLEAGFKAVSEQSRKIDAEIEKISIVSLEFANLERRRQLEEERYRYFETQLEKARRDEILDSASIPNISVVQKPSTPVKSLDDNTRMIAMGLAASGLLLLLRMVFRRKAGKMAAAGPEAGVGGL